MEGLDTGIPHVEPIDPIDQLDADNARILRQEQPEGPLTAEQLLARHQGQQPEVPTERATEQRPEPEQTIVGNLTKLGEDLDKLRGKGPRS